MKAFLKSVPGKICLAVLGLVLLAALCLCGYTSWYHLQPKLQDVTIELGEDMPPVEVFLTPYAQRQQATLLSEVPEISAPGVFPLRFSYAGKEKTATLTVADTTAPKVTFQDVTQDIDTPLTPESFVAEVSDLSETTISFAAPFVLPGAFGSYPVELVVTDTSGNQTAGKCTVHFVWIRETLTLELGQTLTAASILLNPDRDSSMLNQQEIDRINQSGVGAYTLTATDGTRTGSCTVTVQDTVAPTLELNDLAIIIGARIKKDDFIKTCSDASGDVATTFSDLPDGKTEGDFTVTVEAVDASGNKTTATAKLTVSRDKKPPVFSGLSAMSVKKGSSPNFSSGVKAKDAQDGVVSFTVDTSKVNLNKAGTYYAVYTAKDSAGNKATARRKVTVQHNQADTDALVKSIVDTLPNDPVKLMQYVRDKIKYNANWGGDDPVWYGLKNKVGNCYVHAKVLEAFLEAKGFKTQLIWVTDKSHYWNLVYINGSWKHIDSTPGTKHPARLMDDADRYKNLQGRDWDRSKWPACN